MYLPDVKNDASPAGMGDESAWRKLDLLIEKCWTPCTWRPVMCNESDIALTKSGESLQWINSIDFKVSVLWFRSLHNPSTWEVGSGISERLAKIWETKNLIPKIYMSDDQKMYSNNLFNSIQ